MTQDPPAVKTEVDTAKAILGENGTPAQLRDVLYLMYGRAADFTIPGETPRATCERIVALGLPFDQVIQEFDRWVHVAIAPAGGAPRRQVLTARRVGGGTIYEQGLK
jgi:hypothetical protein